MAKFKTIHLHDRVTAHMRQQFASLRSHSTVREALAFVREQRPEGRIVYFYVVGEDNRLEGVVPTRRLLMSNEDVKLADIMIRPVIAIPDSATILEACEFFVMHRLLAFPVVNERKQLIGVVDIDVYTDEAEALERREDLDALFQLIGVHLKPDEKLTPTRGFRLRFPWLLCNVAGGLLAALLTGFFEVELQKVVALALFIPVVLSLAEGVSIQAVTLALQTMADRPLSWPDVRQRLLWELGTGMLLGLACGAIVCVAGWLWLGELLLGVCIFGGILIGLTGAAFIGFGLPNILRLLRVDPRVAAGPIALAAADMLTLLAYFNLARWLLM